MRGPGLGLAVLALVVSLPELARAQQGGLFPNAPIRRQRVPCDQQDPIYKTYKYQYWGYHPTCWRRFPDGWGCPSPEAPNKEKSFEKQPLNVGSPIEGGDVGRPDEGMSHRPDTARPRLPDLPPAGRDPFAPPPDTDKPGNAPAAPRGGQAPLPLPSGDPFQLDKPDNPPANAPKPPRASRTRPAAPSAVSSGPELSAPAEDTGRIPGSRTSRNDTDGTGEDGPLLALPAVNLPPINDSSYFGTEPPQATASNDPAANSTTSPGSPPPRRSFLSGLFSNLGVNWTRR